MSLDDALAEASSVDWEGLAPLSLAGQVIGWVRPTFAARFRRWPELFACEPDSVTLTPAAPQALSDALGAVVRTLADEGAIRGWRNERYTVFSPASGAPLFALERAAMRAFGLTARAAHLNGFVRDASGWRMWVARRSHAKSIDPGMLDNLVAGGIAEGMNARGTLIKECAEEAGISAALAATARVAGIVRATHAVPEGLHDEYLHVYDLELSADFQPANRDAEVAEFLLLTPAALIELIAARNFTVDAALVAIDFLARRGSLPCDSSIEKRLAAMRVQA